MTTSDRSLVLTRTFDAPPELVYRAWTDPEMLKHWFVPRPWTIARAETDVRPGGASLIVMRDPEGKEYPNRGVYLEVIENKKLVVTDAYTHAWEPSDKPFMTAVITFEPQDGGKKTVYTALVLHWNV
ncbi:MAG TPA: SRPBCC domain-containing protein, partial [Oxalicibacterium sp.]|nr:SRPBCC domain-containing protein [Oxalicibacterium sp.]